MSTLRLILGDQLSHGMTSLQGTDKANDTILMCEVWEEATYVKHHQKKIAFLFSAMRHFAQELRESGYRVRYTQLDDAGNAGSFRGEVERVLQQCTVERVIVTHPGEYRVWQDMVKWKHAWGIPVEIVPDNRFLCSSTDFLQWAKGRKQMRMEYFYRKMRIQYAVLMEGDQPIGGQWNYDAENRKPPPPGLRVPKPYHHPADAITREVIALVSAQFSHHFGQLEPFGWAVNREQALQALHLFIQERLCTFGDYQDAMLEGESWMYHAHISFYLNCGLLCPLECVKLAEAAYYRGQAPLHSVEGFIRQIMGWREYIRGMYWMKMPDYAKENFFNAIRKLPDFYWTAHTKMHCLQQCVRVTQAHAYAHHIQRLMVLGNFALLIGIEPKALHEWFLIVYADAYEWVELPNVSGMALFADGGYLASKPYAAGGNYIHKMSNYCTGCEYNVLEKQGPNACPFNYLYWDFWLRNRMRLQATPRMGMVYKTADRMHPDRKKAILADSTRFLKAIDAGEWV